MSDDAIKFADHVLGRAGVRSEASEPLCDLAIHDIERPGTGSGYEDLGRPVTPKPGYMPLAMLVVRQAQDGGFVVVDGEAGVKGVPFLFAAGTIQEVCDYIEHRFDPGSLPE